MLTHTRSSGLKRREKFAGNVEAGIVPSLVELKRMTRPEFELTETIVPVKIFTLLRLSGQETRVGWLGAVDAC